MAFTIASVVLVTAFVALIVAAAVAQHREQFDRFVRFDVAALVLCMLGTVASFLWAENSITPFIWMLNAAIQAGGVMLARRYRRKWRSWQDPHADHICNEDCPDWMAYKP